MIFNRNNDVILEFSQPPPPPVPLALRFSVTPAKTGRRLHLKHAASPLSHRIKLVSAMTSQASGSGAAASPQLPGLQLCDISDLILDSATEPKEGGNGNVDAPHTMLTIENALISYIVAGVVLRAFLNGTEAAVKRPKVKVTLNPRDLKKFTQEVTTMLKASDARGPLAFCAVF